MTPTWSTKNKKMFLMTKKKYILIAGTLTAPDDQIHQNKSSSGTQAKDQVEC